MVTRKKTTKKKTKRKAGRPAQKQKLPGWIILLIGVLFGLAIAVLGYVKGWVPKPENQNDKPIAQSTQSNINNAIEDKSADLQVKPKKDYDFYTTLQEMEVVVDETELTQTDSRAPKGYTIQLGAFKNVDDAEALKAQVAFIGQSAYIQPIVDNNKTKWHRVRIGPFTTGRKAGVVIKSLEKNGFDSIIIKEK